MATKIKLSQNLHEKMELVISQYIKTLRENDSDPNNILHLCKHKSTNTDDIISELFKHSAYPCLESTLFNKIANDYFVKSEYNELQQFNDAYFKYADEDDSDCNDDEDGNEWKYKYNDNIYLVESKNIKLIDPAYVFARLNVDFIAEQLTIVDNNTITLK